MQIEVLIPHWGEMRETTSRKQRGIGFAWNPEYQGVWEKIVTSFEDLTDEQYAVFKHLCSFFSKKLASYSSISYTPRFLVEEHCTFARSFNEHPNSLSLRTLICNTLRRSTKFPANIFLIYSLFYRHNSSCTVFWVSSFHLSVNLAVLYQFTVPGLLYRKPRI